MTITPITMDRLINIPIILLCAEMIRVNINRLTEGEFFDKTPSVILGLTWMAAGLGAFLLLVGLL